ncbi:lipopolysaccharide biosynthesis protein [Shewanella intestini]|uniref:Oligosaccharide flippase family protein n=1 Tax=Shewanella intestini TaxID=2017544 RepID=A0ABS5I2F2_9GAMM|nr:MULTISPECIES: oligosaccharide flippase family protein [Shewanella]MBR9728209.1 oligosaccharide flippase family protein [Shewanella intestini]MRG35674.1 oligosaccharide flippase family protein [Shewanella sp. XMDDZSB0408]
MLVSICSGLSALSAFGVNIAISRLFGGELFGFYSYIVSFTALTSVISCFGFNQFILLRLPKIDLAEKGHWLSNVTRTFYITLAITSVIIVFYLSYIGFSFYLSIFIVLINTAVSISLIRISILISEGDAVFANAIEKLIRSIFFLLSLILFYSTIGSDLSYYLLCIVLLTSYVFVSFFSNKKINKNSKIYKVSIGGVVEKKDLHVTIKLFSILLIVTLITNVDVIILERISDMKTVAYYSSAQKVSMLSSIVLLSVNNVVFPILVKSTGNRVPIINNLATLIGFVSSLMFLLIVFYFGDLILGLFGEDYKHYNNLALLITFGYFLSSIFGQTLTMMKIKEEFLPLFIYLIIGLTIKLGFIYFYYENLGLEAIAYSTILCVLTWNFLCFLHLNKKYKLNTTIFSSLVRCTK